MVDWVGGIIGIKCSPLVQTFKLKLNIYFVSKSAGVFLTVKLSLHTENQLPMLSGSALKV
jgi:hypothetical protein